MAGIIQEPADNSDEAFMAQALEQARAASRAGEVPVGAILVIGGTVVARAHNSPIIRNDPTAHAEMMVLRDTAASQGNYRLTDATLYVTLEPCPMCAGAMVNARIKRLVFGSRDLRFGGVRSKFQIADSDLLNHRIAVREGVLGPECLELLQLFFASRRR